MILKISDTPGKDRLLHLVSSGGFFTAFMTPKRNAGKKSYTVDIFTYGEFVIYCADNGNYLINSFTPIDSFYNLRKDIITLSAAGYIAALARHVTNDADCDCETLMELLIKSFSLLSDGEDFRRVKPVFEIKAAQLLGFEPCLEARQKSSEYFFDITDGRLYLSRVNESVRLSRPTVFCIYKILSAAANDAFSFLPESENELQALYDAAQKYIVYHTEREFPALRFLNGVI